MTHALQSFWQDVYGVSLPPSMFAAVLGFEEQRRTEIGGRISERTAQNVSPIERRLIKLRNQLQSSDPPPRVRIVKFNVKRPAWDQVHCSMTYQATMLKPDTRICRYFRIKVGELPFMDRNPQKIASKEEKASEGAGGDDDDSGEEKGDGDEDLDGF